ncbi:dicarboxylate/amino acid:cation symporter [Sphingomonas abietis]|uniref:Dicarboxylate/amino acid:cation symporter n=1 Tax=Sphingomonas abietis TaxID=3012344 RepID=A0ABY7NM96_9SPHN|nr:dicarboxylate/amino acid:cation symporter [Sphingomonas abietis]WBO22624.1 dicarboxylate/amino acid:cation symporter [Sphingomonas abietis]
MARRLTLFILIGMVLGFLAGIAMHALIAEPALTTWAGYLTIFTDLFLRLIKMIIAPLVFSTLVVGVAHMGDTSALGRIGGRTLGWFLGASLVSLTLGLLLVNLLAPGAHSGLTLPPVSETMALDSKAFNLHDFLVHIVPASMTEAMADNDILPIVVFSIFLGVAIVAVGEKAKPLVTGIEALVAVMLKITDYVMRVAPIAVFAAIAHAVAINGAGIILTFGRFVGSFYLALAVLWAVLIGAGFVMLGGRARTLVRLIREPALLAFSTASSEAAYPRLLEALEAFGVPRRIASFVLPLGYSFNLDGSMIYMTFATLFIAQAYGIDIPIGQQIVMVLILMVTSKGMAGVPRASLVVIAAVMGHFNIPEAGLLLILAVDQFLDMGRSATNVVGNAVAAAVVAKWEGGLAPPRETLDAPAPV